MDIQIDEKRGYRQLRMEGEIRRGDYEKLLIVLRQELKRSEAPDLLTQILAYGVGGEIEVNSRGGDVSEAIQIARLLREGLHKVVVYRGAVCVGSCFLIYLAGAERYPRGHGAVGVHRPDFDQAEYSRLAPSEASSRMSTLKSSFQEQLDLAGVPGSIQEKLFSTPSQEIYWLTKSDFQLLGPWPIWYEELISAKCGITRKSAAEELGRLRLGLPPSDSLIKSTQCQVRIDDEHTRAYKKFLSKEITRVLERKNDGPR